MPFWRNAAATALVAAAYLTNPEERSFRDHAAALLRRTPRPQWLDARTAAALAGRQWHRDNWAVFSVVRVGGDSVAFVGAFDRWVRVPLVPPRPGTM